MDAQQPQRPQRPDFSLPAFQGVVELAMVGANMSREEAIQELGRRWEQNNPPGEHQQENLPPPEDNQADPLEEPPCPPAQPPAVGPECLPQCPTETNPPAFDPDAMVSSNLPTRPAEYALKKIEAFKFVHMWYFMREGLLEAAQTVRCLEENDTLAITHASEGNVTLHMANSLTASKNAKPDHALTFTEYMYTKNHFLTCIQNAGWGNQLVDTFNWFFH
ncbi:hypothetical protein M404DRAFT_35556 [Pisolithus tinctorius Marx 270]|uniref:Uncharacterized protein n=1 Tax=Pisolithus tinctorius Marx 270 TaxID=870435 RepID=A0A0C3MYI7_PISTI|nr:hypothetical protein M404DRAFT_35556 [Pisolithus tinctorius Marx 270]